MSPDGLLDETWLGNEYDCTSRTSSKDAINFQRSPGGHMPRAPTFRKTRAWMVGKTRLGRETSNHKACTMK